MPARRPAAVAPTIDLADDLAIVEAALTLIVRRANLPRLHERLMERAGVSLDRAAYAGLVRIGDEGPLRLTDLAAAMGVDTSTTSRQVRPLEKAGLVARTGDPADGRASIFSLTPQGKRVVDRIRAARRAALADLLADWSPDDRNRLAVLLDRFATDIRQFSED